jgi:hypothetical protein
LKKRMRWKFVVADRKRTPPQDVAQSARVTGGAIDGQFADKIGLFDAAEDGLVRPSGAP